MLASVLGRRGRRSAGPAAGVQDRAGLRDRSASGTGGLRDRAGFGERADGRAWLAAGAVAAGATVIMLVPALSTVTPGTARARRGRQAAISGVTRAGADLALVVLAVLAGWQLRHYSAVVGRRERQLRHRPGGRDRAGPGAGGRDRRGAAAAARGGKAGDRLAARGRRLTAAMASWQISRQPIRQGGAALLIVLAVATGTLALSQRQSWTRSDHDQAAFAAGADVRVDDQPAAVGGAGGRPGPAAGRAAGHAGRDASRSRPPAARSWRSTPARPPA